MILFYRIRQTDSKTIQNILTFSPTTIRIFYLFLWNVYLARRSSNRFSFLVAYITLL
jgi:hypothetical protein